jgi:uncharacterized membrane protein
VQEKRIHQLFQISVALKGLHGIVEIAGGIALAFFKTDAIVRWLYWRSVGKPDWVEHRVTKFASSFSGREHHYYVFFLVSHGILNMALVVGLLREKLWSYPATFAVLTLFIAYQLFRFTHVHDPGLIVFSLLDVIVMGLAWHEYQLVKRHLPTH